MSSAIAHRGPDGSGLKTWSTTALAHRRLSILDLSENASQPMRYSDSGLWITYNGEIYNYLEIRSELESLGYSFRTNSDTEVILAAFDRWDISAFNRFNGMWALAIYDERKQRLVLSVDRFGVKPLYYMTTADGGIIFASELKAFFAVARKLNLKWDEKGIRTALLSPLKLEGTGHTVIKNLSSMGGGEALDASPKSINKIQWWNTADHIEANFKEPRHNADEFLNLLTDAVRIRLRSDVPVASSLSGGLDSSAIVAILSRLGSAQNQTAFVHAFENTRHDESNFAKKTIAHTGVLGKWVTLDETNLVNEISRSIYASESFYPGSQDAAKRIYKSQKENGFSVTIDGHGADELLAGYTHYFPYDSSGFNLNNIRALTGSFFEWKHLAANYLKKNFTSYTNDTVRVLAGRFYDPVLSTLKLPFLLGETYSTKPLKTPESLFRSSPLARVLFYDFHRNILPRILKNFDVTSMSHGVEVRMPFLDHRLVTFSFSLPDTSRLKNGITKVILREATRGLIPEEVRTRSDKMGLNSPLSVWLSGPLKEWVLDSLESPSPIDSVLARKKIRAIYRNHLMKVPGNWSLASKFWLQYSARHWMREVSSQHGVSW